ncbi:MAG: xylulokinase [Candidatus Thorarchaeota archaeon]
MTELVVAIDAGTTGVRSIFFDTSGNVVASAYEEFESFFPQPSWVEQDADTWWNSALSTLKSCINDSKISAEHVIGVSVTNQRETVVPVDEVGAPLRKAIVWQDRRTVSQCDWIKSTITPEVVYSITGLTIDPYFTAPKLLWIKEHDVTSFESAHKFLLVHDFIINRLSGEFVTEHSNASRTMLFDIGTLDWSERLLDEMEIPKEKMPDTRGSGVLVSEVSNHAAKQTGLKAGTPVVTGGGDQQCAALGVGVVRPGSIKSTTGTGTFILAHSDKVRLDPKKRVLCSSHVVPGAYVVEASIFTTGSALRWFRDNLGLEERVAAEERGVDPYEVLAECADGIPPGSEGVIHVPHFAGAGAPHWNPHARGVFAGLALGHTRNHLIRSILEGVSYEIRTNLEVMHELGLDTSEVRVTGGAARSTVWMQIQSDVLGIPVVRTQMEEATALGAAILACKGVGAFKSVVEAADSMVCPRDKLTPTAENREIYESGYKKFKDLYSSISNIVWI